MKRHLFSLMINLLVVGILVLTLLWYSMDADSVKHHRQHPKMKRAPRPISSCTSCGENVKKAVELYSQAWRHQEDNHQKFRSQLSSECSGFDKAILTQTNTPLGTTIVYDGERKRTLQVNQEMFDIFPKGHPFLNKTWSTCAVVGNGGILANSNCGKTIDSAEFVIRCNLPPLSDGYQKHVGIKTNMVTANPTIFLNKYGSLISRRRPLMDSLRSYGNSMMLLPAFSFGMNTAVCLRALYSIQDFGSPIRPVFVNPDYLHSLDLFWRSQGLKETRLSTGMMMVSLALELCEDVHLYGFWPFGVHPYSFQDLTNHYYDDMKPGAFHSMPVEFRFLLQLHSQGVLKLHLGDCEPDEY